uniref:Uncharacterized protein n=1 Tax=Picea glauca TaxID=3330 RepID=A0A117NHT3_PICGL|nr:hypothetical protein ABT39_MTgene4199 [Picea glauca]
MGRIDLFLSLPPYMHAASIYTSTSISIYRYGYRPRGEPICKRDIYLSFYLSYGPYWPVLPSL